MKTTIAPFSNRVKMFCDSTLLACSFGQNWVRYFYRRWGKRYHLHTYMYISWSADSTLQVFCGHNFTLQRTMSIMLLILKARQTGCSCCWSTRDNSDVTANYESKWWKDWELQCMICTFVQCMVLKGTRSRFELKVL